MTVDSSDGGWLPETRNIENAQEFFLRRPCSKGTWSPSGKIKLAHKGC